MSENVDPSAGTKERIDADGFAVISGVLGYREMDTLKGGRDKTPLRRSRAGARHMLGNTSVAALASDPRLLEIARRVLGAETRPFRATLFDKSPTSNWLVVWHQDTALPLRERHELPGRGPWSVKEGVIYAHAPATGLEQVLALRIHLDDSTDKNGPPPVQRSAAQLNSGQAEQALRDLEPMKPYEFGFEAGLLPNYLRGMVYLKLGRSQEAATEFKEVLDHRGVDPTGIVYVMAHLGLARACIQQGDKAKAKTVYQDFLTLWKDADPDIPILKQAKAEYAKLQ